MAFPAEDWVRFGMLSGWPGAPQGTQSGWLAPPQRMLPGRRGLASLHHHVRQQFRARKSSDKLRAIHSLRRDIVVDVER